MHISENVFGDAPRGGHVLPDVLVGIGLVGVVESKRSLENVVAETAGVGQDDARSVVTIGGVYDGGEDGGCEPGVEIVGGFGWEASLVV